MKIIHELINLGKGIYGNGYTQIDVEDLLKIYDEREASGGGTTGSTVTINGHVILDGNGSQMTQQPNLRFNRMIVTNDNVNDQTIVTRPPSVTISTTPPLNPLVGDEWINSTTWKTYVYYDNYWVEESRIGSGDQNFKPVLNSYLNEAAMIADQGTQISGYIYYDIGNNLYYEKLSTYNGLITDYRIIGGSGLISPGAGLSIDNNDRIQLAKLYDDGSDKYYYVDLFEFPKNIGDSLYFNITSNFQNYFNGVGNFNGLEIIDDNVSRLRSRNRTSNTTSATVAVNTNINTASSTISAGNSTLGRTSVISNNVDSNGVFLELIKNIEILSINKSQSLKFDNDLNNNKIILLDDINEKGIEYVGDYEPNFTARSLVTKQYVDSISGTTITGTKTEGYVATIVSGTPTWAPTTGGISGLTTNRIIKATSSSTVGNSGITEESNISYLFGNRTGSAVSSPLSLSLGGTFGNNTPGSETNSKLKLFDAGFGTSYGIGISGNLMEFSTPSGGFAFFPSRIRQVTILSGGNTGFGTATPSERIHVIGNVLIESTGSGLQYLSLGNSFGVGTPGSSSNLKIRLFDNLLGIVYGLGISASLLEVTSAGDIGFFPANTRSMTVLSNGNLSFENGKNIEFGTSTGTKIGTATSQKIGFWNATPIVQPSGDILTALSNLGLVASPTIPAGAGSYWTATGSNIYRNSAVAIGRTTIPLDSTFTVRSLRTNDYDLFFYAENNLGEAKLTILNNGMVNINGGPTALDNGGTTIKGFVNTTDSIFRVYNSDNTEQFRIRGTGMTTFTSSFVHIGNPTIPIRNAGPHIRGAATDGVNRIFTVMNSDNTIAVSIRGDLTTHFQGNLSINDTNIILGTTTGTKIGTATSQKIGFFNATPIVQPTGNILTALSNLGLVASPTISPSDITGLYQEQAFQLVSTSGTITDLVATSNRIVFGGTDPVINGITGGVNGKTIQILFLGTGTLTFGTGGTGGNTFHPTGLNILVNGKSTEIVYYDNFWRANDGLGQALILNATNTLQNILSRVGINRTFIGGAGSLSIAPIFGSTRCLDIYDGSANLNAWFDSTGQLFHARSTTSNQSVRRDELYLNYSESVATTGTINNLAINASTKLLILTGATDLTGVVPVDNTRLLRIEARGGNRIIRNESASSTANNRFSIGSDLTINSGEVYQFIYTDSRWRYVTGKPSTGTGGVQSVTGDGVNNTDPLNPVISQYPIDSTSNTIDWTQAKTFGSFASPITGTITESNTNAKRVVQVIFYQGASFTTPSANWKLSANSATYSTTAVNIIYVEYFSDTYKRYWFDQDV